MMEITEGSHAVAEAVRLCRPQVISAYPITPQTHIVEALADMVANCQLDAEYITVVRAPQVPVPIPQQLHRDLP
jgi:pyruvate ferredoxin oxidoreductase alpha subunit